MDSTVKVLPNDKLNDISEKEFGLTDRDYWFLMWDIEQQIAQANEKYGYSGNRKYDDEPRPNKKPLVEDVMIARGLIKTRRVPVSRKSAIIELEERRSEKKEMKH